MQNSGTLAGKLPFHHERLPGIETKFNHEMTASVKKDR